MSRFQCIMLVIPVLSSLIWFVSAGSAFGNAPVVRTTLGEVTGRQITQNGKTVNTYFGIPFAEPPIGQLRFRKPKPARPWTGVLNATSMSPGCVQTSFHLNDVVFVNMSDTTEDCLTLNIWVPENSCSNGTVSCGERMPVFVFIYGGAFQWGTSSLSIYDGTAFAARTGMIYVSFNYRVGVFGFLNASTPEMPGNMGMYDQVEALRWIKNNVEYFGGDPNAITLAGQSAGAVSVHFHMMSPLSKGLFHKAVLLSGVSSTIRYSEDTNHHDAFRRISNYVNCSDSTRSWDKQISDTVRCLQSLDAHELVRAAREAMPYRFITILPNFGDEFLPKNPYNVNEMDTHVKDVFVGTTQDDGELLVSLFFLHAPFSLGDIDGRTTLRATLRIVMNIGIGQSRNIIDAYLKPDDTITRTKMLRGLSDAMTDLSFECTTDLVASKMSEKGANVYRYLFAHRMSNSLWADWVTATHGDDIIFALGSVNVERDNLNRSHNDGWSETLKSSVAHAKDSELSNSMVDSIAQFCRWGKPKIPKTDKEWPKYTKENKAYLILKPNDYKVAHGPRSTKCHLWEPYLVKRKATTPHPTPAQKPRPTPKRGHEKRPKIKVQQLDNNIAAASRASATVVEAATFVLAAVTVLLTTREL
ncbi:acetylcholinesterase-1-like isoform X2 [Ornithodoros turicata]|uniref:acetylcholinesterase-1-like isoform X2 n=1 Tax=Ornithodoros turicata TaxID=34597 RepID=UPI0031397C45